MTSEELKRRVPTQARGLARYNLVLDTAARLFAEVGYEATTTNAVAEEAGVSIGSLYQYFSGKEAILQGLAARYFEDMRDMQQAIAALDASDLSIEEILDRQIDPYVAYYEQHPGFGHVFAGTEILEDLGAAMHELDAEIVDGIKLMLLALQPGLGEERAALAATVVKGMVKSLFGMLATNPDPAARAALNAEVKSAIAAYVRSLAA